MANPSFDISTGADLQEVDNAVNQALKEVAQRFDFKGSRATIDFDRGKAELVLQAEDDYKLRALLEILRGKLVKRGVPVKNLKTGDPEAAAGGTMRQVIGLTQGLDQETSKKISRAIRDQGFKKVQTSIQGEEIRVSAPSRDELQAVIAFLRAEDFGPELQFGNYRG